MTIRKKPTTTIEADVLERSRRRCCICFGLSRDVAVKRGQIAHLDGDRSNSSEENLAFLCFDHHDEYDSRMSQSKSFTMLEVKRYREELYQHVLPMIEAGAVRPPPADALASDSTTGTLRFSEEQCRELRQIVLEVFADIAGPLRSVSHLSHKLGTNRATTERVLFELAHDGVLRVDRPRSKRQKTYSLASSVENRLIDTFLEALPGTLQLEERYVRRQMHEVDSVIRTTDATVYAVETMLARKKLTRSAVEARLDRLARAKTALGLTDALSVLLIGITRETPRPRQSLAGLESEDVVIRFIEVDEQAQPMGAG